MVMENTTPAIVIMEPAMVESRVIAPSGPMLPSHRRESMFWGEKRTSRYGTAIERKMAAMAIQLGISQRLNRSLFNQFKTQAGISDPFGKLG